MLEQDQETRLFKPLDLPTCSKEWPQEEPTPDQRLS